MSESIVAYDKGKVKGKIFRSCGIEEPEDEIHFKGVNIMKDNPCQS